MATETEKMFATITREMGELTTAVKLSIQKCKQQERLNTVLLEKIEGHSRSLYGFNSTEGVVGQNKTQEVRLKNLEVAEEIHADRLKWALRAVLGSALVLLTSLIGGGVLVYLGWK